MTQLPSGFAQHVANIGVKDDTPDYVVVAASFFFMLIMMFYQWPAVKEILAGYGIFGL